MRVFYDPTYNTREGPESADLECDQLSLKNVSVLDDGLWISMNLRVHGHMFFALQFKPWYQLL